jgi:membrane protein
VVSWRPWYRAFREALLGDTPVLAAGVALFSILAAIPGLAAIVSVYGLVADPADIATHLDGLSRVLPDAVVQFLIAQLEREATRSTPALGFALATTVLLALYSARSATDAMIIGLNRAYGVVEQRRTAHLLVLTVAVASAKLVAIGVLAAIIVSLPETIVLLDGDREVYTFADLLRWPLLALLVTLGLAGLYRAAPSPRDHDHRRLFPGAVVATTLWVIVSYLLSLWVKNVADYEILYGAFASVIVVILWFYTSALSVLLGGLVNAELERSDLAREIKIPDASGPPPI